MPLAARVTDMHTCPAANGPVPHVGGPIIPPCCPTVTIQDLPAARVTDMATCVGPPDTIIRGAATVTIGGLPAARQFDNTAHGGVIVIGCPTVIIGDASVTFPVTISAGSPQREQIQAALAELYSTPTGREIIQGIADSGHSVNIQAGTAGSFCSASDIGAAQDPSRGSNSTVTFDSSQILEGLDPNDPRSSAVTLGHEMIHAYHNANGTNSDGPDDHDPAQTGTSARGEERSTVGSAPPYDSSGNRVNDSNGNPAGTSVRAPDGSFVPGQDYSGDHPTENSLRDDFGMPQRPTYYPSNWPGGAPW